MWKQTVTWLRLSCVT